MRPLEQASAARIAVMDQQLLSFGAGEICYATAEDGHWACATKGAGYFDIPHYHSSSSVETISSANSHLSNAAEFAGKPLWATLLAELPTRHLIHDLAMMLVGKLVGY